MKYIKTSEVVMVEDYPYGYKKTKAYFSIEFKKNQGFRFIKQIENPKTGKLNAPKKSTYHPIAILIEKEDGKTGYTTFDFYGDEGFQRAVKFMAEYSDLFTEEQFKSIASKTLTYSKADMISKATYCGSDVEAMMKIWEEPVKLLVEMIKTGKNLYRELKIDFEAIEKLKVEGYQPFKITEHRTIN